jgi:hypothetical protein
MPMFRQKMLVGMDTALSAGATDVLVKSTELAPFENGGLRADKDAKRTGKLEWTIYYYKEYARYQEFGGDKKRTITNYTTSGTGAHYLKKGGDSVAKSIVGQFRKYSGA